MRWILAIVLLAAALFGTTGQARDRNYEFTKDGVTADIPVWNRFLREFRGRRGVKALEIGAHEGRSAIWFLDNVLTGKGSDLTCVDPWRDATIEERFDANLRASGHLGRVHKLRERSQVGLWGMSPQQFDFIYIDGCHKASCVMTDAVLSLQLVKFGGLILFDDYGRGLGWEDEYARPIEAIDAFLSIYRDSIAVLYKSQSLVIVRRVKAQPG